MELNEEQRNVLLDAIQQRHSVRSYTDRPISEEALADLTKEIALCNEEGDLHIQLITNDPETFEGFLAHYGKFSGVQNYIALIGKNSADLDERSGYYGEHLVLKAQALGLNTCWVGATFRKGKCQAILDPGEKLVCVISIGYGVTPGVPRKSKSMDALCNVRGKLPEWFREGMQAALLAPTAMNQQKFRILLKDQHIEIKSLRGFYTNVDLGIVKYHFEIGAGKENFCWQ